MKKKDVVIGETYIVKVSGRLARVRINSEGELLGGWFATNLDTGRKIRIKTGGRLRERLSAPAYQPIIDDTQHFFGGRCDVR